jgi:hypothetical protein
VRALVDFKLDVFIDCGGLVDFYYVLLWTVWTIIMDCSSLLLCTV